MSALGYFVDVYDIILFTAVRVPSLKALSIRGEELTSIGLRLLNIQLLGMLVGGIVWGMIGDKQGRMSVLFGSIILYSSANLANAFVNGIQVYAVLRFIAGFGLAGELGAGVTLFSEMMSKENRGYGTMIIATAGICGGITNAPFPCNQGETTLKTESFRSASMKDRFTMSSTSETRVL